MAEPKKETPVTFKAEGYTLVATAGNFRVILIEVDGFWCYSLERKGLRLAHGRALEKDNQKGAIRTAQKLLREFSMIEPHLGACKECDGDTYPFNPAMRGTDLVIGAEWYEARAKASKEFFNKDIPDFLVYRCLSPNCELHKQPQRYG